MAPAASPATRTACAPGRLKFSRLDSNYTCGKCKARVAHPAGRKRIGNVWVCPDCLPGVSMVRACCGGPLGFKHKARCPMARARA